MIFFRIDNKKYKNDKAICFKNICLNRSKKNR